MNSQESGLSIKDLLLAKREEILRTAAMHGASNVRVFGSVARGEAGENSDIDLLVELDQGRSLLDQAGLMVELEDLLGRKVDVVTEQGLYWLLRRRILKEARPL
jgi:predicted nucleotidyltransferase